MVDEVADMKVDMVDDMVVDEVADLLANMKVDKVADMVAGHACWLIGPKLFRPEPDLRVF